MPAATASARLAVLAQTLAEVRLEHPLRVAVDGRTGCGKSTFADALADRLADTQRPAIRASIDDFHHPAVHRRKLGRYSAEGYYRDARDLRAFVELLLRPLGPGGNFRFARQSFDLAKDAPVEPVFETATADAVLIADGTFLQRPELRGHFDFAIFLDAPEPLARERATARDAHLVGSRAEAEKLYDLRYGPAFRLYEEAVNPLLLADAVVR